MQESYKSVLLAATPVSENTDSTDDFQPRIFSKFNVRCTADLVVNESVDNIVPFGL